MNFEVRRHDDKYRATLIAENGDTWELEYHYATETGVVRGSDVDDEEYKVTEGVAYNLVMDRAEKRRLRTRMIERPTRSRIRHYAGLR